jgi:hypothetical protein
MATDAAPVDSQARSEPNSELPSVIPDSTRQLTETQQSSQSTGTQRLRRTQPARSAIDRLSFRTRLRRHLIDPIQTETGVDPVAIDTSWGLVKIDASATGAGADLGGELVHLRLLRSPLGYDATDSPAEVTATSVLRRCLRNALTTNHTDTTTPEQPPSGQRQEPIQNDRRNQDKTRSIYETKQQRGQTTDRDHQQPQTAPDFDRSSTHPEQDRRANNWGLDVDNSHGQSVTDHYETAFPEPTQDQTTPTTPTTTQDAPPRYSSQMQTQTTRWQQDEFLNPDGTADNPLFEPFGSATGKTNINPQPESGSTTPAPIFEPSEIGPANDDDNDQLLPGSATIKTATPPNQPRLPETDTAPGLDPLADWGSNPGMEAQVKDVPWENGPEDITEGMFNWSATNEALEESEFLPGFPPEEDTLSVNDDVAETHKNWLSTEFHL